MRASWELVRWAPNTKVAVSQFIRIDSDIRIWILDLDVWILVWILDGEYWIVWIWFKHERVCIVCSCLVFGLVWLSCRQPISGMYSGSKIIC